MRAVKHGAQKRREGGNTMKRRFLRSRAAIMLGVVGLLSVGASGFSTAASARAVPNAAKPTLTFGTPDGPESLNPALDVTGTENLWRPLITTPIFLENPNGTFGPGLAASWKYVGAGNETFSFTLKHGVRFSDGSIVTAAAVEAWLIYYNAHASASYAAQLPLTSINTVGNWTVVLHVATPNPLIPYYLSNAQERGYVNGPTALANPASYLASQSDGAGPYMVDPAQTVAGDHYTFVPNPYYAAKAAVHFSSVVVKVITDPQTMLEALTTGQVNVAYGDQSTAVGAHSAGFQVLAYGQGTDGLEISDRSGGRPTSKPFESLLVRQALNYAMDRKAISHALFGRYGSPTDQFGALDAVDPKYNNYYPYNPTKAKQLLAEAGYPNGFTVNVVDIGFAGNLGDPLIQAMAQDAAAVGVTFNITTGPTFPIFFQGVLSGQNELTNAVNTYAPMYATYTAFFKPGSNFLTAASTDQPQLTTLYNEGAVAKNPAKYWLAISRTVVKEADTLTITTVPAYYYLSKHLKFTLPVTSTNHFFNLLNLTTS